jgi:hypothetical protein
MEELDASTTEEELSKAIYSLAHGKAPGGDGIPAEVLQCAKPTLMRHLHTLLCQCREEGSVPQDMRDANIVTLYKNKGDRSDCNNYRGISLLSIVGKAFARVALKRLQLVAERVYPESQCGFRAQRSTIDMIFTLRQLPQTEAAPVYRTCRLDKGLRPCQQKGPLPAPRENRMLTDVAKDRDVFP